MLRLSDPRTIERGPYQVVGVYCTYEGDDEGPGWAGAARGFFPRRHEITNRQDDVVLGFLYRPHRDDPTVPENVRACFIGVEVSDLDHVPAGMATTFWRAEPDSIPTSWEQGRTAYGTRTGKIGRASCRERV